MANRVLRGGLKVAEELDRLVRKEILPGTGVSLDGFWTGLEAALGRTRPGQPGIARETR